MAGAMSPQPQIQDAPNPFTQAAERSIVSALQGDYEVWDKQVLTRLVRRVLHLVVDHVPDFVPPEKKVGSGDAEWLLVLADSFEERARKRLPLRMRPRQTWNVADGLRRAANNLDAREYTEEMLRGVTE